MIRHAGLLAVIVVALLGIGPLQGRGLVPADGIFAFPPWSTTVGATPSNALLSDQYTTFAPLRQFVYDEVSRGRFPLWNPHAGAGMPTIASAQGALLYPINLALVFVPPFYAAALAAGLKLWLAGVFMMLFMRELGASRTAALASAIVFACSGYMIVWLGSPQTNVAILLPLLLYLVERDAARPTARTWVGLALTFAAIFLGGHPPTAVHVLAATAIYAVVRLWSVAAARRGAAVARLAAALVAGVLVAAPQVFTYAEYYAVSSSADSSASLQRWKSHLTLNTLVGFVLPKIAGTPSAANSLPPERLGLGEMDNFNERTVYGSVLALFLALIAIVKRREWTTWFFGASIVGWLTIAYGAPPWPWIFGHLPVFSAINPERAVLLVIFAIAVLAGFGLDWLRTRSSDARRVAVVFGTLVIAIGATVWLLMPAQVDRHARFVIGHEFIVPSIAILVVLAVSTTVRPPRWTSSACVAAIALDVIWFGAGYNPAVSRADYYPSTPAIDFLKREPGTFRVLGLGAMPANTAEVYGLDDVRGVDFMSVKRYEELLTGHAGDFWFFLDTDRVPDVMNLLNVKYLVLPERQPTPDTYKLVFSGDLAVYEYLNARPRAMLVFDHRVEPDAARLLADLRQPGFKPEETLLLETEVTPAPAASADLKSSTGEVSIASYAPNEIAIDVSARRSGFLLLLDTYYPGWKAYVNERETPILRADYAFRAVQVPSGKLRVRFVYRPASFRVGLAVSGVALGLLVIIWFRHRVTHA